MHTAFLLRFSRPRLHSVVDFHLVSAGLPAGLLCCLDSREEEPHRTAPRVNLDAISSNKPTQIPLRLFPTGTDTPLSLRLGQAISQYHQLVLIPL